MALSKIQNNSFADNAVHGRRNLVMNGAMNVAQRGTRTDQTSGYTACDRFQFVENGSSVVTTSQDTDVPSGEGFSNSLKIDVTNANPTVSSGNYALLRTKFEGQDLQHLLYGTSSAKTLTLSFWVKSPKTGTHVVELHHTDAGYHNSIAYTVNSANTWENKVVTFDGYQTTAFDNDADRSLQVYWWLMAGSDISGGTLTDNTWTNTAANQAVGQVNVMDSDSNNFYLTGVQLEVGSTATEFEHRSYAEELLSCYRYLYKWDSGASQDVIATISGYSTTRAFGMYYLPVEMNHDPEIEISGNFRVRMAHDRDVTSGPTVNRATTRDVQMYVDYAASGSAGFSGWVKDKDNTAQIIFEAEI